MKKDTTLKGRIKRISLSIVGFVLIFSVISMILVKVIYDGQFPRYDKPHETITARLRYKEFETNYPRESVSFFSGKNRLQGYVYGTDQNRGIVVVAHGLGGGALPAGR